MKRKNTNNLDLSPKASLLGMVSVKWRMLANMILSINSDINSKLVEELAKLYIKWGATFNIRPDFAWSQMCIETDFLIPDSIKTKNNNFCGLTYLEKA